MRRFSPVLMIVVALSGCSIEKLYTMKQRSKVNAYEQIDFHDLMKRYMQREPAPDDLEGIYSVSIVVNKKGGMLSDPDKERIIQREENYQEVAILRDAGNPNRDYVVIPLDKKYLPAYSIRGEFTRVADANLLVYKHLESKGKSQSYTFTFDRSRDMLEGIRKDNSRNAEYTYQMTYVRLSPTIKKR